MSDIEETDFESLIAKEGWISYFNGTTYVIEGEGQTFPYVHPVFIHLKLYKDATNPDVKFRHMKRADELLWPHLIATWNHWTERRFKEHCNDSNIFISYAGGGNIGKSLDAARIAIMFWMANPEERNVTIASVTLASLEKRIWGYVMSLLGKLSVDFPFVYTDHPTPKVLYDKDLEDYDAEETYYERRKRKQGQKKAKIKKDKRHGMFAITANRGDSTDTISTWIGQHPDDKLLIFLDEGTNMPIALVDMIPNLNLIEGKFQLTIIANSDGRFDLHGMLSTPREGWDNISPFTHSRWETTQKGGVCLYFNPYESPAILETDPEKKKLLSRIFLDEVTLAAKEAEYGKTSKGFWRFVLGFWQNDGTESVVISEKFFKDYKPNDVAEWSGIYPVRKVAGLDVAFSTGGDNCVMRIGYLGHTTDGKVKLDFMGNDLLFYITVEPAKGTSAELQIAERVIELLEFYRIPLDCLALDATGQGRVLGELLRLKMNVLEMPFKIYTIQAGQAVGRVKSFDVVVKSSLDLWTDVRDFVTTNQICGLDPIAMFQFSHRQIEITKGGKRVLEPKRIFKQRMNGVMPSLARSPDEADAIALAVQAAKLKYGFAPGQLMKNEIPKDFASSKMHAYQQMRGKERELEKANVMIRNGYGSDMSKYAKLRGRF